MYVSLLRSFWLVFSIVLLPFESVQAQENTPGWLEGRVVDAETQRPVAGALITFESVKSGQKQQRRIGPAGGFRFTLLPDSGQFVQTEYFIRTAAPGYLPTKEKFIVTSGYATRISGKIIYLTKGTAPPDEHTPVQVTATPTPVTTPTQTITAPNTVSVAAKPMPPVTAQTVQKQLQTLQFVQSKAELLPNSQPALDQLLTFMRENPTVRIELAGHTDNQGSFDENLTLSRQRVDLVKAFLVKNGITASRIISRGYGSTRPIASNNAEETRRLNRRVEMVILTP